MRTARRFIPGRLPAYGLLFALAGLFALSSCGDGPVEPPCDSTGEPKPDFDSGLECRFPCLLAHRGDDIDGDTYDSFAMQFFSTYCIRCHSVARTDNCFTSNPTCRNGAPFGRNWDDPASIRGHLTLIRDAVAVHDRLFMPPDLPSTPDPSRPAPSCEERYRIARWIDAGAPGL